MRQPAPAGVGDVISIDWLFVSVTGASRANEIVQSRDVCLHNSVHSEIAGHLASTNLIASYVLENSNCRARSFRA